MAYPGEKVFNAERAIKYFFLKPERGSPYLLVVFSGFVRPGQPPKYQYIRSLSGVKCNKLFILDEYGPRGCYYLGENKDFYVERSVISLIKHIAEENKISFENIIAMGSSKGGWASLYFALKYGFGYVIAGAPQVLLGNYLCNRLFRDIADFIAGGSNQEHRDYLNSLLFDVVAASNSPTKIFIHLGVGDHHYKEHVLPLAGKLKEKDISYAIDLGAYKDHGQIGAYFPIYFSGFLKALLMNDKNRIDTFITKSKKESLSYSLKSEQELNKIRNSTSYKLGNLIVLAARQPGRNTILLPYRLCRLLLESSRKKSPSRAPAAKSTRPLKRITSETPESRKG